MSSLLSISIRVPKCVRTPAAAGLLFLLGTQAGFCNRAEVVVPGYVINSGDGLVLVRSLSGPALFVLHDLRGLARASDAPVVLHGQLERYPVYGVPAVQVGRIEPMDLHAASRLLPLAGASSDSGHALLQESLNHESFKRRSTNSPDTDGDGSPDLLDPDDDNDGIPDTYEIAHGLNALVDDASGDKDKDGMSNLHEFLAGTAADVASSVLAFTGVSRNASLLVLTWQSVTGKVYHVHSGSAPEGQTSLIESNRPADPGPSTSVQVPTLGGPGFYRIEVQP